MSEHELAILLQERLKIALQHEVILGILVLLAFAVGFILGRWRRQS